MLERPVTTEFRRHVSCMQVYSTVLLYPHICGIIRWIAGVIIFLAVMTADLSAQQGSAQSTPSVPPESQPFRPFADFNEVPVTDAEKIARLQRAIQDAQKRISEIQVQLADPQSEYALAEADFSQIDQLISEKMVDLKQFRAVGDTASAEQLDAEIKQLDVKWELARKRFDLAIQERKTQQEQLTALEKKIEKDQVALNKLQGTTSAPATEGISQETAPVTSIVSATQPAIVPAVEAKPENQTISAPVSSAEPARGNTPVQPPREEVLKARQEAEIKAAEAHEAAQDVQTIEERLAALNTAIENERKLLETAQQRATNEQDTERTLYDQFKNSWEQEMTAEQRTKLRDELSSVRERLQVAQTEINSHNSRLNQLQNELNSLLSERLAAQGKADEKQQEAQTAAKEVARLESPFALGNIRIWLLTHGVRIVGIILCMMLLLWMARNGEGYLIKLLAGRNDRGSMEDRQNRAHTLASVFRSAARLVIIIGGMLMLLTELNVNIAPLLGGAAVLGLAVAFGAQNLIRDFFYGFMILLENQYMINDVIKVGDISGQVERITLRLTVLRGLDGTVHFVPNGEISKVSNMTHGWSRALFDIGVAYKEDIDEVMKVLTDLGRELRRDPEYRDLILDDPEMLGLDEFGNSAVIVKFLIKTRPLKQWLVRREMLRRIKIRFDQLGIEIPFPHQTVYHRYPGNSPQARLAEQMAAEGD
ncbi:MAG: hypothetical protein HJJLKODD_02256 [Phycisphaerae bacterium]|nr:hypothetical protein [Phycisphaerae bacterium]